MTSCGVGVAGLNIVLRCGYPILTFSLQYFQSRKSTFVRGRGSIASCLNGRLAYHMRHMERMSPTQIIKAVNNEAVRHLFSARLFESCIATDRIHRTNDLFRALNCELSIRAIGMSVLQSPVWKYCPLSRVWVFTSPRSLTISKSFQITFHVEKRTIPMDFPLAK